MRPIVIAAILLIALGTLGLVYRGFTYTKETHETSVGPVELALKEKERVHIPVWAGVGAIALGGGILLFGRRKG